MEQRHCARMPLQFPATLEVSNAPPVLGRIRNISSGGLFIETRSIVRFLPTYAALTINFNLPGALSVDPFRLLAILARRSATGVGVMFLFKDLATSRTLSDVLSYPVLPLHMSVFPHTRTNYLN